MRDPVTNVYTPSGWETVPCPVCKSTANSVYEKFGSEMQYTYVRCHHCSLVYSSPRPVYDQDYIDSCYAFYYQYAEHVNSEEQTNFSESSLSMFEEEINHLLKFDKNRTAVLDIGSGMGTFLNAAKPHYQSLTGLDVSEKMAEFVKRTTGINVVVQQFEDFNPAQTFSLIHMSHVIEHIPDPNRWLQHAKKLLAKDGILVINVPNKMSFSNQLKHLLYKLKFKKQFSSSWNDPTRTPDHLYEPTIKSFTYLVKQNGYEILDWFTYSRRDPASNKNFFSRLINRTLHIGSNLSFIVKVV